MTTNQGPAPACPNCGHTDTHTPMMGCLYASGMDFCDCKTAWKPTAAAPPLPTVADAIVERDAAMATVAANTHPEWVKLAVGAVQHLADLGPAFSTDEVWERLEATGAPRPHDPRALGPVMKRAVKDRMISPTGNYTKSRRRHASPIPLYVATTPGARALAAGGQA